MQQQTIRDRLWLWGMKVNALQETNNYGKLGFGKSTMTVEQAIERTGIYNVFIAGHLPIDQTSLELMPSAKRIICKTGLHHSAAGNVLNYDRCLKALLDAKKLAARDVRIDALNLDDFSTGTIDAGAKPEHLSRLQFANAANSPQLSLGATIYTMSIERPELPPLLSYFAYLMVPLWHTDQIDTVPAALERLSELSGGKPMQLCLYVYDFGNVKPISRQLMQQQLDLAEKLLLEQRIVGLVILGTCMMDLDWEANDCFYKWLNRVGDRRI